jgi:glycosyltransferase involved in cell wall biosynthesis
MPGMVGEVKKRLKEFEIIHLHCFRSFQNIVIHHYTTKYGVPYILDAHGSLPRKPVGEQGFKWLLRWFFDIAFGYRILEDACKVVAETEVGVSESKAMGVSDDGITLIKPPLAVEEFAQLPSPGLFRRKYGLESKEIVLSLGRIHWIKGLDFLVKGFSEVAGARSDVVLAIVGNDDGYKRTLDKLIGELELSDRVFFTGFLSGVDKLSALVDADVMVQTSRYEQGAWAPFEAVLCGTPIIVNGDTGAGENVKQADAGYLVEYGNTNNLRDNIQYVLDNSVEARKKTQKAEEYIKSNLSLEREIEKYEKLYQESIEKCNPACQST